MRPLSPQPQPVIVLPITRERANLFEFTQQPGQFCRQLRIQICREADRVCVGSCCQCHGCGMTGPLNVHRIPPPEKCFRACYNGYCAARIAQPTGRDLRVRDRNESALFQHTNPSCENIGLIPFRAPSDPPSRAGCLQDVPRVAAGCDHSNAECCPLGGKPASAAFNDAGLCQVVDNLRRHAEAPGKSIGGYRGQRQFAIRPWLRISVQGIYRFGAFVISRCLVQCSLGGVSARAIQASFGPAGVVDYSYKLT